MERQIGKTCRKVVAKVAAGELNGHPIEVDVGNLVDFLGKRTIHSEEIVERTEAPGVAIGLAWTATGGDIMFFETTRAPGDKGFTVTCEFGRCDEREGAKAALSYVRSLGR